MPATEQLRMINNLELLARHYCRGRLNVDDLLSEVFVKVFSGERKWQRDLDLQNNLWGVLTSLAFNERRKLKRLVPFDNVEYEIQKDTTALQKLEADEDGRRSYELIFNAIADDPFLIRLVEQLLELGWKPTRIALALGVDPKQIYSQKRRLQRRFGFLRPAKQLDL